MLPYNHQKFDSELQDFLQLWPEKRIKSMTIDEYSDLTNHDSFCYWLEYGTKHCGEIGGIALHKFELWKPKEYKEFKNNKFIQDSSYAWNARLGTTSKEAFDSIKEQILEIINCCKKKDWKSIDTIPFHAIGKWKVAFLYSDLQLFPVYSQRALHAITQGMGTTFKETEGISTLQEFILSRKKKDQSVYTYYHELFSLYALPPNFYVIGSKYGDENGNDTVPKINDFIKNRCVATGFMEWADFSDYMYKDAQTVNTFIAKAWPDGKPSMPKKQRVFRLLSQLKQGDIIAIKSHGRFNQLTIIAYAMVVQKNGFVYDYDPDDLGHRIHVDFLETGLYTNTGLNYSETIHQIKPTHEHFKKIFGWYALKGSNEIVEIENEDVEDADNEAEGENQGHYNAKQEGLYERGPISAVQVRRIHNEIQNKFIFYLKQAYPQDIINGEKTWIDAQRETSSDVFIYEIKPSISVYACIREGIGQLLDYHHQHPTKKPKKILIVGQSEPEDRDLSFIENIKSNLQIPFTYLAFDKDTLTAKEF